MKDILLDKTGDLYVTDTGDICLTDSVRQAILIRLRWFLNEWMYNRSFGLPYFEDVLIKNPQKSLIKQLFAEQILSVEEVLSLEHLDVSIDSKTRSCQIKFTAKTTQGNITEEVKIDEFT